MGLKNLDLNQVTYFKLNNQLNIPVDNKIQLGKDKEALQAFLKENVEPNTKHFDSVQERLDFLVGKNYIDGVVVNQYTPEFLTHLFKVAEDFGFEFQSFMAAYKFYNQYALKTNDGEYYLEGYEDRALFNALYYADGDEKLAENILLEILNQRFQPATPSFMSAGRARRGELVSCFVLQPTDDMNSINRLIGSALSLSKIGGGVGINLSNLRGAGDQIKGIKGISSGVVPVMKLLEDSFSYANQLGQRQGAGVAYLNAFHPDVLQFLSTKKENADEKIRVKTLSLGLIVPDKYYELVKKNEDMYLFSPYDVERIYGVPFNYVDITNEYDNLVANPEIAKKKIRARELEEEISKLQQESGYPYVVNIDVANRYNHLGGKIISSNLCTEILQEQTTSIMNEDGSYKKVGGDISCNLGSINIVNMMKHKDFETSVATMVRSLSSVSNKTHIENVPSVLKNNEETHAIGLGAMGLAAFFAQNQIEYGSDESLDFVDNFFNLINYYTLKASNELAKKHGSYVGFEKSDYANGVYFIDHINNPASPKTAKIEKIFDGIHIPTETDWGNLAREVHGFGLYNKYRQAIAPTGSISYVNNTTASLLPIVNKIEERTEGKMGKVYYPAPGLSEESIPYYKSAYDTDMRKVIDVYAAAQKHIDQGMSLTLFMRSTIPNGLYEWKTDTDKMTTRDLSILRNYAFSKNIKSLYYVRTFTDDNTESGVNECESCSI